MEEGQKYLAFEGTVSNSPDAKLHIKCSVGRLNISCANGNPPRTNMKGVRASTSTRTISGDQRRKNKRQMIENLEFIQRFGPGAQ